MCKAIELYCRRLGCFKPVGWFVLLPCSWGRSSPAEAPLGDLIDNRRWSCPPLECRAGLLEIFGDKRCKNRLCMECFWGALYSEMAATHVPPEREEQQRSRRRGAKFESLLDRRRLWALCHHGDLKRKKTKPRDAHSRFLNGLGDSSETGIAQSIEHLKHEDDEFTYGTSSPWGIPVYHSGHVDSENILNLYGMPSLPSYAPAQPGLIKGFGPQSTEPPQILGNNDTLECLEMPSLHEPFPEWVTFATSLDQSPPSWTDHERVLPPNKKEQAHVDGYLYKPERDLPRKQENIYPLEGLESQDRALGSSWWD